MRIGSRNLLDPGSGIRDLGWKNSDPESGNMPDPQHWNIPKLKTGPVKYIDWNTFPVPKFIDRYFKTIPYLPFSICSLHFGHDPIPFCYFVWITFSFWAILCLFRTGSCSLESQSAYTSQPTMGPGAIFAWLPQAQRCTTQPANSSPGVMAPAIICCDQSCGSAKSRRLAPNTISDQWKVAIDRAKELWKSAKYHFWPIGAGVVF